MSDTISTQNAVSPWRFTVAPMLDWTDRHCRFFDRLLTRHARLYTEMVTTGAIRYGNRDALLGFSPCEHPVALQLGGSDPADLAFSIEVAEGYGYDEYNLNCGCPSPRVQKGSFGACLMLDAKLVADCVRAMRGATDKPVTVKHRIGVDDRDDYAFVRDFVGEVREAGCRVFIVHARSAWLKGLSPKENREVPPLKREVAYELKKDFPDCTFVLNGGIADLGLSRELIDAGMDGVMIGRAAYQNPWMLTGVDGALFDDPMEVTRLSVIEAVTEEVRTHWAGDEHALRAFSRHLNGLCQGLPGARAWRRTLADPKAIREQGPELFHYAWRQAFGDGFSEEDAAEER
ncbi:tRNA dihydrouridine(20/20a) synthase DusA [Sutterella sp.]|uniref:tRNA dihydrouridine(20/20a) synthase DusA n=1 Tax=Sutterella sp. TaxID=1981025 RepID=UPI0026E06573|nr:tRNA dihydrouridine(20/20a) synthase DusA [Sutterella sp.]MDO5531085.1 tRNA dihydrouridine(20/20a) synthase DusA [Sutterella sp.]